MKLTQLKKIIKEEIKKVLSETVDNMPQLIKEMPYTITSEGTFMAAYFGENALRYRSREYPNINDGDEVLEMHIDIQPKDQGKGLAEKMIKVFLYKEGGVAFFNHNRITNPAVYKVFDKIATDPKWLVQEEEYGSLAGITIQEK